MGLLNPQQPRPLFACNYFGTEGVSSSRIGETSQVEIGPRISHSYNRSVSWDEVRRDPAGIEVAYDQVIAIGPPEGVGEHFVRVIVHGIVEFLLAPIPVL